MQKHTRKQHATWQNETEQSLNEEVATPKHAKWERKGDTEQNPGERNKWSLKAETKSWEHGLGQHGTKQHVTRQNRTIGK